MSKKNMFATQIKRKTLGLLHSMYFYIKKKPRPVRYFIASFLLVFGTISLVNPLIPGWLLISLGIGIFYPDFYYRFIGKHARTNKFYKILKHHEKKISNILSSKSNKSSKIHFTKLVKSKLLKRKKIKNSKK